MTEQAKILRVFKLISMLKSRPRHIDSLAEELDVNIRTIYRYIHLLEDLGFIIDKDWKNRYFIHTNPDENETNIHFSGEEAHLLQELINSSLSSHPLKEELLKKLFVNSDIKDLPEQLVRARLGKMVQQLAVAMKNKNQVMLRNYHSAHGHSIRDRFIEPFGFGDNFETVVALDTEDNTNKQFKIERIGEVVEQDKSWKQEKLHSEQKTDVFGVSSEESRDVVLKLSMRAYLLMREEFPKSAPYLSQQEDAYYFKGIVKGFKGIGRFVMGLVDEVQILAPYDLIEYVNNHYRDGMKNYQGILNRNH